MQMIESNKGVLVIDEPLAIGVLVSVENENGELIPATDGEYIVDGQKIEVKDGKVESIETLEVEDIVEEQPIEEVEMEEQPVEEEQQQEPDEKDLRIEELEGLLKDRDAVIEELTAKIKELEEQINKPVEEPVKMSATVKEVAKGSKENPALKYFN